VKAVLTVPHLALQRTAALVLLASVGALAAALALAYSHGQYTEYKHSFDLTITWRSADLTISQVTDRKAPTLVGALRAALVPLVLAGLLLGWALKSTFASFAAKRQPDINIDVRICNLDDHQRFLGRVVAAFGVLVVLALGWLVWAVYIFLRGPVSAGAGSLTGVYRHPEPVALLAPLLLVAVALVGLWLSLVNRDSARVTLNHLKRAL
jgi:hypothetical protein